MRVKVALIALAGILLILIPSIVCAAPITIYVPNNYLTIQEAVDTANPGDTIIVRDGTYTENIDVNKDHLTIRSENGSDVTIVQAATPDESVFEVTADYAEISGFTVEGGGEGIYLNNANHCEISDNMILNNNYGVFLNNSSHNNITDNTVESCPGSGITLEHTPVAGPYLPPAGHNDPDNQWRDEPLAYDGDTDTFASIVFTPRAGPSSWLELLAPPGKLTQGVRFWVSSGDLRVDIYYDGSWHCLENWDWPYAQARTGEWVELSYPSRIVEKARIRFNPGLAVTGGSREVRLNEFQFKTTLDTSCSNNNILGNAFSSNGAGIRLYHSSDNRIYLNNFVDNTDNGYSTDSSNIWNSPEQIAYTYNSKTCTNYLGNYWDDYGLYSPPVGHNDPDNQWQDEPLAYDENRDAFAKVYVGSTVSSWLELLAPPGEATQGLRFWVSSGDLRVDIYYDGSWHCLENWDWPYAQAQTGEWVELSYPSRIVEKARIRFNTGMMGRYNAYLYEFQFKTQSDYAENDVDGDGIGDTPYIIDSDQDNYPLMIPFENYKHTAETFDITLSRVYLNTSGGTGPTLDDDFSEDYYDYVEGIGDVIRIQNAFSPPLTEPLEPFYWFHSGTAGNTALPGWGLDVTLPENQEICLVTPGGAGVSGIMEDTGQADFRAYFTNPVNVCEILSGRWTDAWVNITRVPYEEATADNVSVKLEYGTGWYKGTYYELGVRLSLYWWNSGVEQQSEPIILMLDNPSDVVGIRLMVTPTGSIEAFYNVNAGAWQSLWIATLDWWSENYSNVAYNVEVENYSEKEEVQVDVNTKYWESGNYQLCIEARAPVESVSSIDISGPSYLDTATVNKVGDPDGSDYPKQLYNDGQHWDNEAGDEEWAVVLNIDALPLVGEIITFDITYADDSTETMQKAIDGVFTETAILTWPADGSIINTTTPEFQWQCLSIAGLIYSVQIDDLNHNRVYNAYDLPDGTISHIIPGGYLNYEQTYCWLVSARDANGNEALANYDSFKISEPAPPERLKAPTNYSPQNGQDNITLRQYLATTDAIGADGGCRVDPEHPVTAAHWQIREAANDYSHSVFEKIKEEYFCRLQVPEGVLEYSTMYYWHVRYRDQSGLWSDWSQETSFTTRSIPLFDYSPLYPLVNEEITFDASAIDLDMPSATYIWDFGDGNVVTEECWSYVTYSYSEPNMYTVTLIVIDKNGDQKQLSRTIEVSEKIVFRFVHMTDVHIGAEGSGWNAKDRFARALVEIACMDPRPDFVLISGDLVEYAPWSLSIPQTGCWCRGLGHYRGYLDALASFAFHCPEIKVYPLPGNHDRYHKILREPWYVQPSWGLCPYREYVEPTRPDNTTLLTPLDSDYRDPLINYSFKHKGFLFIGLDSGWDYIPEGQIWPPKVDLHFKGTGLYADQMEALKDPTKVDSGVPKIIFMHHPAMDNDGRVIKYNRDRFITYCNDNDNKVQLILTGHTHEDHIFNGNGEEYEVWPSSIFGYPLFIQTPSVGKDGTDLYGCEIPYGYRVIEVEGGRAYPQPYTPSGLYPLPLWKASLCSSGNLHVYDSLRRHVGINAVGKSEFDIPYSFYFTPYVITDEDGSIIETSPEEIIVFDPNNDYLCEVQGTDEGAYRLSISLVEDGSTITFEANDIPILPNAIHQYTIDWKVLSADEAGATVQIDSDGDGAFEQTVTADNDLTHDEFILQVKTSVDFEPDTLNLKSEGKFVTVYIELPGGFDIGHIDISSVMLNNIIPALVKPTGVGDYDNDGLSDLMVKFKRVEVQNILSFGERVPITISGEVFHNGDRVYFKGSDIIKVINP
ncbi:MAG: metallophosphoesterase [Deltaproteobacteria bacterium]|nr:metallophosphoesterase [Deltaproteobacteria bacterium]